MAYLAHQVQLALQDLLEQRAQLDHLVLLVHRVLQELLDRPDLLDQPVHQVLMAVKPAPQEYQDLLGRLDRLDLQVHLAQLVLLVQQALLVHLVLLGQMDLQALLGLQDQQALLVSLDQPDPLVPLEQQELELLEIPERLDPRDQLAHQGLMVLMELRELQDLLAPLVLMEPQAQTAAPD